tara:strand:+ start:607 stop:786 length:180 start_codon:yes stop_codon:yes gene_type:complete
MEEEQNKLLGVSENGKDLCISCGEESDYSYYTHIDYRIGYIEGAGQLCKKCYANMDNEL